MQKQFNLIYEPWIRAVALNGQTKEYNLKEILCEAHKMRCLAGELVNQDFAVLRFLLAVMQTIVYRYQIDGKERMLTDPEDAFHRWRTLWDRKKIPEEMIEPYLKKWGDRFWLVHPSHPFYQIPEQLPGKPGTSISAGRLIGAVGESDNKSRIFSPYSTVGKRSITDGELARWILHFQGYDTKATKISRGPMPPDREKPHARLGWCGNLGAVYIEGKNLFETLLLNLVLLRTDTEEEQCFGAPKPSWERDYFDGIEDHVRADIDNQAELLSIPSRWLYVRHNEGSVSATAVNGETIELKDAFLEQMTLWKPVYVKTKEGTEVDGFMPSLSDPSRLSIPDRTNYGRGMWNRFSAIVSSKEDARNPGILLWAQKLMVHKILPEDMEIVLKGVDTVYHKQQGSSVLDIKGNTVDIRLSLLSENGTVYREMLEDVIELTNSVAELYGAFYMEVNEAVGHYYHGDTFGTRFEGAESFYGAIDPSFRKWLSKVDASLREPEPERICPGDLRKEWEHTMFRIADTCAREKICSYREYSVRIRESETAKMGYFGLASTYDKFWFSVRKITAYELDSVYWNPRPHSNRAISVSEYVKDKIAQYQKQGADPKIRKELAALKRSVGREMKEVPDVCDMVLRDFPDEYRSDRGYTKAERAVFYACTLYADGRKNTETEGCLEGIPFGRAVRRAALDESGKENVDDLKKIVKHFNRILGADQMDALMLHLVACKRAIGSRLSFDYGMLAYDLYTFQLEDSRMATVLSWSADFLRNKKKETNG